MVTAWLFALGIYGLDQLETGANTGLPAFQTITSGARAVLDLIASALTVADEYDVQVAIHTDSLNEAGFGEDTISAFNGRTIHTYHTEGVGGGHAPDIIKVAGLPNVLPSSTNPTLPYTINSVAELLDMVMVCHHLNPKAPEDVSFAESRVRAEPAIAHGVAHTVGSLEAGKMADIVLWPTRTFGAKPRLIVKGGQVNWASRSRLG